MCSRSFSSFALVMTTLFSVALGFAMKRTNCPTGWIESVSVPGKCYNLLPNAHESAPLYDLSSTCLQAIDGADVLAIANAFENQEIVELLRNYNVTSAAIGRIFHPSPSRVDWISRAGYSSYTSNADGYWIYGLQQISADTGLWGDTRDADNPSILCQLYPDNLYDTAPLPPFKCPEGWHEVLNEPHKCYYFDGPTTDYFSAVRFCDQLLSNGSAQLATIDQDMEATEIAIQNSLAGLLPSWINYLRENSAGWYWSGGAPPENYTITLNTTLVSGPFSVAYGYDYFAAAFDESHKTYCQTFIH